MIEENHKNKGFGRSFEKGWDKLPLSEVKAARTELMRVLGIGSRKSFISYKKGRRDMRVSQAIAVEMVFMRHGVTACWSTERTEGENEK